MSKRMQILVIALQSAAIVCFIMAILTAMKVV